MTVDPGPRPGEEWISWFDRTPLEELRAVLVAGCRAIADEARADAASEPVSPDAPDAPIDPDECPVVICPAGGLILGPQQIPAPGLRVIPAELAEREAAAERRLAHARALVDGSAGLPPGVRAIALSNLLAPPPLSRSAEPPPAGQVPIATEGVLELRLAAAEERPSRLLAALALVAALIALALAVAAVWPVDRDGEERRTRAAVCQVLDELGADAATAADRWPCADLPGGPR